MTCSVMMRRPKHPVTSSPSAQQPVSHEEQKKKAPRGAESGTKQTSNHNKYTVRRITPVKETNERKSAVEACQSKQSLGDVQHRKYQLPSCHSDMYNSSEDKIKEAKPEKAVMQEI